MENKFLEVAKKQNAIVLSVIGDKKVQMFEKAYLMANAVTELRTLLNDEYMKPILSLQSTKLGFLTDKDKKKDSSGKWVKGDGYPAEVVKDCLIEAVFKGLMPTGNEFNIIGGNMYPTKEGLERKANEMEGLVYSIISQIKSKSADSCLVESTVKYTYFGTEVNQVVPIPLKIDSYTSVDSIIGKAKRKALAWMLSNVTGEVVLEGAVEDVAFTEIVEEKKQDLPVMDKETFNEALIETKAGNTTADGISVNYSLTDEQYNALKDAEPKN